MAQLSDEVITDMLQCQCNLGYSIEPHGDGWAIYYGRCDHFHGANLGLINECYRKDLIEHFETQLNNPPVIYKSAASGLWYKKHGAAGDIAAVEINGQIFEAK